MEHKFQIIRIRLMEAHFAIIHQYNWEKTEPIEFTHNIEIGYKQTNNDIHVLVSVSADSDNQPFRFSVACEGSFSFEEIPLKEELDRIARIYCAAIIYPYVRETVADLTRRASMPPLNLAPFNFVSMYEERQKAASPVKPRKLRKNSKA